MSVEIERKFLVKADAWRGKGKGQLIRQGYLNKDPDRTIRVRASGDEAVITIKSRTVGASKLEFEYPIPPQDAEELLRLCIPSLIEKTRFRIWHVDHEWEVDDFLGDNRGLVVAEVELEREDEPLTLPDWVGREVTDDPRYFNSSLSEEPYSQWPAEK
jgi:adenylate cyclase